MLHDTPMSFSHNLIFGLYYLFTVGFGHPTQNVVNTSASNTDFSHLHVPMLYRVHD